MIAKETIVETFNSLIDERLLENCKIYLRISKSQKPTYDSIILEPLPSVFYSTAPGGSLFARFYYSGIIAFSSSAAPVLQRNDIAFDLGKDGFCNIDADSFENIDRTKLSLAFNEIFLKCLNFPTFGCCSRFRECSTAGHCLHNNYVYAAGACQYKRNLDSGKIFY